MIGAGGVDSGAKVRWRLPGCVALGSARLEQVRATFRHVARGAAIEQEKQAVGTEPGLHFIGTGIEDSQWRRRTKRFVEALAAGLVQVAASGAIGLKDQAQAVGRDGRLLIFLLSVDDRPQ